MCRQMAVLEFVHAEWRKKNDSHNAPQSSTIRCQTRRSCIQYVQCHIQHVHVYHRNMSKYMYSHVLQVYLQYLHWENCTSYRILFCQISDVLWKSIIKLLLLCTCIATWIPKCGFRHFRKFGMVFSVTCLVFIVTHAVISLHHCISYWRTVSVMWRDGVPAWTTTVVRGLQVVREGLLVI